MPTLDHFVSCPANAREAWLQQRDSQTIDRAVPAPLSRRLSEWAVQQFPGLAAVLQSLFLVAETAHRLAAKPIRLVASNAR